MQQASYMY